MLGDPGCPIGVPWEMNPLGTAFGEPSLQRMLFQQMDGKMQPYLAESWEIAPDHMSITLNLRKGVKFHDGTDWNATAAKWNLDKWMEAKLAGVAVWTSVDVVNDYTVRINLKEFDNAILANAFSGKQSQIISPTAFEKNGIDWARTHPVGTGPFKFVSYQRDVNAVYERNDNYWQAGKPYLDKLELIIIKDPVTAQMAFKAGQLHEIGALPAGPLAAELQNLGYEYVTTEQMGGAVDVLIPSSNNPDSPFADIRVRQAVEYAINKEAVAKATGFGFAKAAYQLVSDASRYYSPDLEMRKYDPDKARQLLADAGHPDGFKTKIIPNPYTTTKDTLVAIQQFLAQIGIDAELDMVDYGKFADHMYVSGWEGLLADKHGVGPTPTASMKFYWSGNVFPSVKFPAGFREAYNEALVTTTVETDKVQKVYRMLFEDATAIGYWELSNRCFLQKGVHEEDNTIFDIPPWTVSESSWLEKSAWIK
jgi:peptide/nickel transport system substrate-binding protein